MDEEINKGINRRIIEDEMKESYLAYSMSVIVGRALPDVRDGLKPVHRRILYAMNDMGMQHNKPFKKSARIVGEVLGKYHPHGDSAVYESMVRMVQPFALRYPLINGQGNFGSIDGDSAAAMRYTEAKLKKLSEEMLQDIEKETVKFIPNFDDSLKEPTILPAKVPNLLINGSSGIAVGMATNIPPHNINEICNGTIKTIENPEITIPELIEIIKGPDFPTGGIICGTAGIKSAYHTGRGKIKVKGKFELEENGKKRALIVTEIPYQVNKSVLIEHIAELVKDKKIQGITDLRDESDRDGMRIVIELKSAANPEVVQNQLLKHTRLQTTFGVIMLALVNNQPRVLNLKQIISYFIQHRQEIVRKRTEYDLRKAEEKAHLLAGLIIALDDIDTAIKLIKSAKSGKEANILLNQHFKINEIQAQAILDMKLQRLTSMEQDKIREEQINLLKKIKEHKDLLADENKILNIIKEELKEIEQKYGDERRSQIVTGDIEDMTDEDFIKPEDMVVTISHIGYTKRLPVDTYRQQKRGGKGVIGAGTKEEDFIEHLFIANTHSYLLIFTNKGKIHWLKVFQIPEASRTAKGTPFINLVELGKDEKIMTIVPVKEFDPNKFVFFVTQKGIVKKTSLEAFSRPRKGGILAINLGEKDNLIKATLTEGNDQIILATNNGIAIRFDEKDVREMGRTAGGVRGIRLKENDNVIGMIKADSSRTLLTVTEKGFGKRTEINDYRLINRGGVGVINLKITEKNGKVVKIKSVKDTDDIMLISKNGIIIRINIKEVSIIGRATQGVRIMRIKEGDQLVAVEKIVNENE